ncbi:DNA methyltransferase [Avibacterium paragallinarum]|uniref:Methyltransferase n=3 Tax=Avibacterium TaxID=292486 RepID=A0A0F5EWP4_AVIPA|nr:DNA methyltransferase [Avibacterium paragallinarum]KAA6209504.1 DNA adenine methylase [Avibacterium paragallinarum]KKB00961.1 DNA adenine methylase [Avibacterium paragallinarum]RZN59516.1 DNA adenine methylase [Avibacterium paragallinarum]RZN74097.1 DNA adenine methylase [Avibacterium paragallinarum]SUU98466.1 Modification methylase HindIII [Avibacterium paragallinarum]
MQEDWKSTDLNVDSLWLFGERDKRGKHKNVYHGNFIPQIPYQLIKRYTKEEDTVLDLFMGSGTTLYECENLNRSFIGFDINDSIIDYVRSQMKESNSIKYFINHCDVSNPDLFSKCLSNNLKILNRNKIDFFIAHPPYMDIIKFTNKIEDLSQIFNINLFIDKFTQVISNAFSFLEDNKYFAIVIGDVYKNSEVVPLGFYLMYSIRKYFKVKLKGIVVKNIEGNRGKLGKQDIWKYRALKSDYFLFKHEYIMVFKKLK